MTDKIKQQSTEELLALVRKLVCNCTDSYCPRRNTVDTLAKRLKVEDQWVPVAESGDRWVGRTLEEAESAMAAYPAGGTHIDGYSWDGITHIEHEQRHVTEWVVIP